MMTSPPIVIGGGPAGAASAIYLLRANARPVIYERQEKPGDALCGGFLSWSTLSRLEELGISGDTLGGHVVRTVRLTAGRREWQFPLPQAAMGVSRKRLDDALLTRAESLGADVRREAVRFADGAFWPKEGPALEPASVFLATGKYDMRGLSRDRVDSRDDPFLGLRVRFAANPTLLEQLSGVIEMHLFDRGYAGLVLHEAGQANLCMALRKSKFAEAGGSPDRLLAQLGDSDGPLGRCVRSLPSAGRTDAIGHVPYGWRALDTRPGLFRLGDQAGVIPSLVGEGIGIALASADLAVDYWQRDGPAGSRAFQRALAARLQPRLMLSGAISSLAINPAFTPLLGKIASVPSLAGFLGRLTRI